MTCCSVARSHQRDVEVATSPICASPPKPRRKSTRAARLLRTTLPQKDRAHAEGRSFHSGAMTAPSSTPATSRRLQVRRTRSENQYTVDGVSTTALGWSFAPEHRFEYLQDSTGQTVGFLLNTAARCAASSALSRNLVAIGSPGEAITTFRERAHARPVAALVLDPPTTRRFGISDEEQPKQQRSRASLGVRGERSAVLFGSISPRFVKRTNTYISAIVWKPGTFAQADVHDPYGK